VSDVLVLCYHAVSETWPARLSVTPDAFERQIRLLHGRGFRGVTLSRALTDPPPGRVLAVTFDDAYRSVCELARPILAELGMVGSVYAPTAWVGRPGPMVWRGIDEWADGPHRHELTCMGWDELGALAEEGWDVGSHTRSHPRLPEVDDASLADELAGSREDCERNLGGTCDTLAYPYGALDDRVVAAAGRSGYRYAVTLPRRVNAAGALRWPRVGVYHADTDRRFRLKVSPLVRTLRSSPAWGAIDGASRLVARA
jgi:peptidoglycan/xylan/chitin deacetylase (PgdA/CDA1 family)